MGIYAWTWFPTLFSRYFPTYSLYLLHISQDKSEKIRKKEEKKASWQYVTENSLTCFPTIRIVPRYFPICFPRDSHGFRSPKRWSLRPNISAYPPGTARVGPRARDLGRQNYYVDLCICIYTHLYVYIHIYICIYIHTHIYNVYRL